MIPRISKCSRSLLTCHSQGTLCSIRQSPRCKRCSPHPLPSRSWDKEKSRVRPLGESRPVSPHVTDPRPPTEHALGGRHTFISSYKVRPLPTLLPFPPLTLFLKNTPFPTLTTTPLPEANICQTPRDAASPNREISARNRIYSIEIQYYQKRRKEKQFRSEWYHSYYRIQTDVSRTGTQNAIAE